MLDCMLLAPVYTFEYTAVYIYNIYFVSRGDCHTKEGLLHTHTHGERERERTGSTIFYCIPGEGN